MPHSPNRQLARLLAAPHLDRVVPTLAPEALHRIVQTCGLDACGDIVALATPAQLTTLLDLDVWQRPEPGRNERFDFVRFGEWLEVLSDTSPSVAARTVANLDTSLVVTGLSRFVRVFDLAAVEPFTSLDGERIGADADSQAGITRDIGGYRISPRLTESWDAIVELLTTLVEEYPDSFRLVMRGCRQLSNSGRETDGLDALLSASDQAMADLDVDRDSRRARQGYSSPAEARAFLGMARHRTSTFDPSASVNPLVEAWFRAVDEPEAPASHVRPQAGTLASSPTPDDDLREAEAATADLLASVEARKPRGLLGSADGRNNHLGHVRMLLERSRTDRAAFERHTRELAFLANTLAAGCSFQARGFTPSEASAAAAAVCNLGLERWSAGRPGSGHGSVETPSLIVAFELGWTFLFQNVSLLAVRELSVVLAGVRAGDTSTHTSLLALRRELARQHRAGTPWKVRDALDVLAILDVPTWTGLLGLLDECPVLPAVVTATVERHTGAISATDYAFISTERQIAQAQSFVARLPALLGP